MAHNKANDGLRPSASVRRFPIEGGLLLLFAYNDTARHAWELIESGRNAEDFACAFAQSWKIPVTRARADLRSIVAQWRMQGLLAEDERQPTPTKLTPDVPIGRHVAAPPRTASHWVCTIRGKAIAFTVENDARLTPIRRMLKHLETPNARPQARIELKTGRSGEMALYRDGRERGRMTDPAELVGGLWQTILECLHANVRWRAVLHGAALTHEGTGLALSGASGSGKTTLAAGLIARGFGYLADDIVAVAEPDGAIMPCPLPLSIKPGSVDVLKTDHPGLTRAPRYRTKGVTARLLVPSADAWDADPVRLEVLILPRFVEGAPPRLRKLLPFETLESLLTDRVWLGYPITEPAVVAFLAWLKRTPAYAISYGTFNDGVHLVERVIA
jgi:hypothetical protein